MKFIPQAYVWKAWYPPSWVEVFGEVLDILGGNT